MESIESMLLDHLRDQPPIPASEPIDGTFGTLGSDSSIPPRAIDEDLDRRDTDPSALFFDDADGDEDDLGDEG